MVFLGKGWWLLFFGFVILWICGIIMDYMHRFRLTALYFIIFSLLMGFAPSTVFALELSDPGFTNDAGNIDRQWGLAKTRFVQAWEKSRGLAVTTVAIVDTGVDLTHEDLQLLTPVPGFDFINNKAIASRVNSDDNGHGTLVTGVLAATPDNNKGVAGTNWQIGIMPIKALDSNGEGTASNLAKAIVWATDHGAHIINLSAGGIGFAHDSNLADSISYAFNKNVLLIAAVGNDGVASGGNLDKEPVFPVCDDNGENMVLGVTATDTNDTKPVFANYGKNCIDVSAPGKRILSTINHDPITKRPVPDAYAYASGSSLAVPFVSGLAALIKSAYPEATNKQIRDRIIASSDNIDALNLTQCGGKSCAGLLGAGRVNAERALSEPIFLPKFKEGDLVTVVNIGQTYFLSGGRKQPVSPFVLDQRFKNIKPRTATATELEIFPDGQYATPLDGTLVKNPSEAAVYMMSRGLKLPVTFQVFQQYGFNFNSVITLSNNQISSWLTASLLSPPDGTLVKISRNKTVYWVVGGVLHPISFNFFKKKGLDIFPILNVSESDLRNFAKGEAYFD